MNHNGNFSMLQYYFKAKSHKYGTKSGPTYFYCALPTPGA